VFVECSGLLTKWRSRFGFSLEEDFLEKKKEKQKKKKLMAAFMTQDRSQSRAPTLHNTVFFRF